MTYRWKLTPKDREKRDTAIAALREIAFAEINDYEKYEPLVLNAVRGIGANVWTYLDEGPGYVEMNRGGVEAFFRLRRVRNQNRAIFDAIMEKPKRFRKPKAGEHCVPFEEHLNRTMFGRK